MKHDNLPKELLEQIEMTFNTDPMVVSMKKKREDFMKRGLFREAMQISQNLEKAFDRTIYQYNKLTKEEIEKVPISKLKIPLEDKEKISSLAIAMFMACDLVESATIDANDILKKYDKDLSFEMFSEFRQLAKLAKVKLKFLKEQTNLMQDFSWGDNCDELYEIAKEKATSLLKNMKNKEDLWENKNNN